MDNICEENQYALMNKTTAELIGDLMISLGNINQEELAALLSVTQPTISRWVKGAKPDHDSMVLMAQMDPNNGYEAWFGPRRVAEPIVDQHMEQRPQDDIVSLPSGKLRSAPGTSFLGPKDLKVLGFVKAGKVGYYPDNGETLEMTDRPPQLVGVPGGYAVYVDDDSMVPALKPGFILWVHPKKPALPGDNIIIQLVDGQTFVKELVRRTEKFLICKQWNPEGDVRYDQNKIKDVHLVVGSGIGR